MGEIVKFLGTRVIETPVSAPELLAWHIQYTGYNNWPMMAHRKP